MSVLCIVHRKQIRSAWCERNQPPGVVVQLPMLNALSAPLQEPAMRVPLSGPIDACMLR